MRIKELNARAIEYGNTSVIQANGVRVSLSSSEFVLGIGVKPANIHIRFGAERECDGRA